MQITIELTEETAACLWANQWEQGDTTPQAIGQIVARLAENSAADFRSTFPNSIGDAVSRFREASPATNA